MPKFPSDINSFHQWIGERNEPVSDTARFIAERAAGIDGKINAFTRIDADKIAADTALSLKEEKGSSKLKGLPVGIKGNICIKDTLTTCSSRILEGFVAPYNATVIEKLLEAGAMLFPGLMRYHV